MFSEKENPFKYEIVEGKKGNYYKFNINAGDAKTIWDQAVAKSGRDGLASLSSDIVKKYLSVYKRGHHSWYGFMPRKTYMSWLLK